MGDELTLILRLRDEATKQMKSARAGIIAAGAAIAAAGFKAGAEWDKATKTIVSGTGATGKALKGLQKDYQAVAKYGENSATAIADLNTHLGFQGKELQLVAEAALKAGVNTNQFGDTAAQLGLNAKETVSFLDQMVTASQESGLSVDQLTMAIGKNSARFQAAGGSVKDLTALVVEQALEFGPTGLRGAMSEIMEEVDKGLIPTVGELSDLIGDSTDRVEQNYKAGKNWRDTLREMKDAALGYIGPAGDMLGVLGSTVTAFALAGPQIAALVASTPKLAAGAFAAKTAMVGLGKATLVVGAAYAGWKAGRWIGEITGLTDAVERGALRLMGYSKEAARAAQDGRKLGEQMAADSKKTDDAASAVAEFEQILADASEAIDSTKSSVIALDDSFTQLVGNLRGDGAIKAALEMAEAVKAVGGVTQLTEADLQRVNGTLETAMEHYRATGQVAPEALHRVYVATADLLRQTNELVDSGIKPLAPALESTNVELDFMGISIPKVTSALGDTEASSKKLEVTLAALAGQMGGAAGQALNLMASMIQTNDQLKEGEEGFSRIEIGAAVAASAFHTLGDAIGGTAGKILSSLGDIATAFATGGWVAAAIAGVGALIKGLKSLFGPSEAELEARKMFAGFHKGVVDSLGGTQRFAEEVQRAINDGWDRTLAETRAGFILWGTEAGLTYEQAFADYERYQNAVSAGNTELMNQIEADYDRYRKAAEDANAAAAKAAEDANAAAAKAAEDAAARAAAAVESATRSVISAYKSAEAAGVDAYDETYQAAIESGLGQEEAAKKATEAQQRESAKVLRIERKKYVDLARFNAALAAIQSGNAEGAAEAARTAARETRQAWNIAYGQVTQALEAIPTQQTIDIEYRGTRTGEHGSTESGGGRTRRRQHGGPVSAGRPYLVGEAGPEMFVPSSSGSVAANKSLPTAEEIGAAVAAAMQRAPIVVPQDQVTGANYRNGPRWAAWHGYA